MPRPRRNFLGNTSDEQTFDDRIEAYLKLHPLKKKSIAGSTTIVSFGGSSVPGPPGPAGASVINATKLTFADTGIFIPLDTSAINAYRCDATGGNITLNLPPAAGSGAILHFAKIDRSANKIIIVAALGDFFVDAPTFEIVIFRSAVEIYDADGGQWDVRFYSAMG